MQVLQMHHKQMQLWHKFNFNREERKNILNCSSSYLEQHEKGEKE